MHQRSSGKSYVVQPILQNVNLTFFECFVFIFCRIRMITGNPGGILALQAAGFEEVAGKMKLTRVDPGLLYLSYSILDTCIELINGLSF